MITLKAVEHVAKLARLSLTCDEKKLYVEQLGKILDYFDQLKKVDTTNIEPMAHTLQLMSVMREDEVISPPGHAVLLKNAPDKENGYFRVPKISE